MVPYDPNNYVDTNYSGDYVPDVLGTDTYAVPEPEIQPQQVLDTPNNALAPQANKVLTVEDYAEKLGVTPAEATAEYLKTLLPAYAKQFGWTKEQATSEANLIQQTYSPAKEITAIPNRNWKEALITDPLTSLAKGGNALMSGANWLVDFISPESWDKSRREWLKQNAADIDMFASDGMKARIAKQDKANKEGVLSAVFNAALDPVILSSMILESLPSMAVPVGASAAAGKIALKAATAAGLSATEAASVATNVAQRWAMIGEGVSATGAVGSDIDRALDKANITDDIERAKWQAAALPAGIITAALGKFSPVEASMFTSKLVSSGVPEKLIPSFLKNGTKEALEEYLQSGNEAVWTNIGAKQTSITDPKAWDGVAVDAALGALVGFGMGGSIGAATRSTGGSATTPEAPAQATPTNPITPDQDPLADPATVTPRTPEQVQAADTALNDELTALLSETIQANPVTPDLQVVPEPAVAPAVQQTQGALNGNEETQPLPQDDGSQGQSDGQESGGQGGLQSRQSQGQEGGGQTVTTQPSNEGEGQRQGQLLSTPLPEGLPSLPNRTFEFQGRRIPLTFADDVDKALYMVGSKKRLSNSDTDYMTWLVNDVFPDLDSRQVRDQGQAFVRLIKSTVEQAPRQALGSRTTPLVLSKYAVVQTPSETTPTVTQPRKIKPIQVTQPTVNTAQDPNNVDTMTSDEVIAALEVFENAAQKLKDQSLFAAINEIEAEVDSDSTTSQPDGRTEQVQSDPIVKKRIGKSRATSSAEGYDPGLQALQLDGGRESDRRGGASGSDTSNDGGVVDPSRASIKESSLLSLAESLALIEDPEAKTLSDYLYMEYEQGYGNPEVDRAKVARARILVYTDAETKKIKRSGITPNVLHAFTDPETGDVYDSQIIQNALREQPISTAVQNKLVNSDLRGALELLSTSGSSPLTRAVASRLTELDMGSVSVVVGSIGVTPNGGIIAGRWQARDKVLKLDPKYGFNEHVLLHEATHAATVQLMANPITAEQKKAIAELLDLYNTTKKILGDTDYAFTNLAEFVAESFSNPVFQSKLYAIRTNRTSSSAWQRFVTAIVNLVGLDTVLGRVMNVSEALFKSPVIGGDIDVFALEVQPGESKPELKSVFKRPKVNIKRSSDSYIFTFDNQASTQNLAVRLEHALKALGMQLPESLNLRINNVLKRSQSEAALRKWEETHWTGVTEALRRNISVHGKTQEDIDKFLEQQQVLGRAAQKVREIQQGIDRDVEQVIGKEPPQGPYRPNSGNTPITYLESKQFFDSDPDFSAVLKGRKQTAQQALAEADKYLTNLEKTEPAFFTSMLDTMAQIKKATTASVDARVKARMITQESATALNGSFKSRYMPDGFYIPLQLDDGSGDVSVLKSSTGSNFKANQPLARIYAQAALTFNSVEANTEKQMLLALARRYEIIDDKTGKPLIEVGPIRNVFRSKSTGAILEGKDNLLLDRESIGLWVDGAYIKVRISDPALRTALTPVVQDNMLPVLGATLSTARYITQVMSAMRTSLNPGFGVFNFIRDQLAAAVYLDPKIKYTAFYGALPGAVIQSFKNVFADSFGGSHDAKYQKALDNGAFISQRSYLGLDNTVRDVNQDLNPTLAGRTKAALKDPLASPMGKMLTSFSQALESSTRLAVYNAALASGLSERDAAYQAKTTTTNFERKSDLSNKVSPFYMFANAKLQGIRTFQDKTLGVEANPRTQAAMGMMVLLGLIAAAIGYEDAEKDESGLSLYAKIPDYKRDTLLIMGVGAPGIPLPQEAALFYVLGNAIGDGLFGTSSLGEVVGRVTKNILQQASPLSVAQTDPTAKNTSLPDYIARLFIPALGQPVYDLASNKDTFGRTITPTADDSLRFKGKRMFEKYKKNENPTSVELAKQAYVEGYDISPPQITYMAKFLEGGSVTFWRDVVNPEKPNPLAKRFGTDAVTYGDKQRFNEAAAEIQRARSQADPSPEVVALDGKMEAFKKQNDQAWRGFQKFSPEQTAEVSKRQTSLMMKLLRDYYVFKGDLKD